MSTIENTRARILITDDDEQIRRLLRELLQVNHDCEMAGSGEEALAILKSQKFDLVLSDINMPGISGLEMVPLILKQAPDTVVLMISGQQTIDFAIESMRVGAFDYITKPLDLRQVEAAVDRGLKHRRLLEEKRRYENHLEEMVKERTAKIEHLAYHDRLTDLPNRALFTTRCEQAFSAANHRNSAVLLISLDRFKKIIDTLGHAAGDVLLTNAATRIQSCVRPCDLVAMIDGDEFGLLIDIKSETEAADIAAAIAQAMKPAFRVGDSHEVFLTNSVGISIFPSHGQDAAAILRNAGAALDWAKQQGGNNYQFYKPEMNAQALTRLGLESNLRLAIDREEFVTHYQPIVNLTSGDLVGFEALVRWQHPRLGLLPPGDFIALAEDTGIIVDIGNWVMGVACKQTRCWQQEGLGPLRIGVNVSARQFREKQFSERIVTLLSETGLDPQCLELEITETSIMENSKSAIRVLSDIRAMGVRVSIDDFGTGYSSLSYLKQLPIDTVKLDRSFVNGATSDPKDAALVMAIITLAHNLNLSVIAEGIETEAQRDFLRLLRCDEGQGYWLGRPTPPDIMDWTKLNVRRRRDHVASFSLGETMQPASIAR